LISLRDVRVFRGENIKDNPASIASGQVRRTAPARPELVFLLIIAMRAQGPSISLRVNSLWKSYLQSILAR